MSQGHIYIAQSPSYPGIVKVGLTTQIPTSRVKSLPGAGSLATWTPYAVRAVGDVRAAERLVHAQFDQLNARVKARREMFTVAPEQALRVVEDATRVFPPSQVAVATSPATRPCTVDSKWAALLSLPVRAGGKMVPLQNLLFRHASTFDAATARQLFRLGLECVNPGSTEAVYQVDRTRAAALEERLFLDGETRALGALKRGDLLVVKKSVN
jgi:hypothetical protein